MTERPISEAFSLIADYAIKQGWIPIGFREFVVGPWKVTVNGTKERIGGLDPFHASIEHEKIVAFMVINPYGGSQAGWKGTETDFIADMQKAIAGVVV